jgi:hypothetical protein
MNRSRMLTFRRLAHTGLACMMVCLGLTAAAEAGQIKIGNVIYLDADYDGKFDAGEGVDGVEVRLYLDGQNVETDLPVAVQNTSGGGKYLFTSVNEGSYFLHIPAVEFQSGGSLAFKISIPGTAGDGADDDVGEDGVDEYEPQVTGVNSVFFSVENGAGPVNGPTGAETGLDHTTDDAADADGYLTVDMGFMRPLAVGNLVYVDTNANGHADAGEGVPGIVVQLFAEGADPLVDGPLSESVTDALGHYLHSSLVPGNYFVHIPASQFQPGKILYSAQPWAYAGEPPPGDDDASEDSLASGSPETEGVSTVVFALAPGTAPTGADIETGDDAASDDATDADVDLTKDFGFSFPNGWMGIGNLVFIDRDLDYSADPDEGVDGVEVQLFLATQDPQVDPPLQTRITEAGGRFLFGANFSGGYKLHIPASQFASGAPLEGAKSAFGYRTGDGDDNNGEIGDDAADPTTTGVTSREFEMTPGAAPTAATGESGTDAWMDNFADAQFDLTRDMGFVFFPERTVGVGNLVFLDGNQSGSAEAGEGVDGVTVQLFHEGQSVFTTPVAEQTTSGGGFYHFTGLQPGKYYIFLPTSNFQSGAPLYLRRSRDGVDGDGGVDDTNDENGIDTIFPADEGVSSIVFTLVPGSEPVAGQTETGQGNAMDDANDADHDLTIDFAFIMDCPTMEVAPESLASGQQDVPYTVTFTGTGGVLPYVWGANGIPPGMTLNSSTGVLSGTPTAASIYNMTVHVTDATGCRTDVIRSLLIAPPDPKVGVGNVVFVDTNLNRKFDSGEGIAGVTVQAFNEGDDPATDTPAGSAITAAGGLYRITNLLPGNYFLHIPAAQFQSGGPLHNKVSVPNHGLDDQRDDDLDENGVDSANPAATGISSVVISLQLNEEPMDFDTETGTDKTSDNARDQDHDLTVDFGFIPVGSGTVGIGNVVYVDTDNDGRYDSGEGRNGVTVQLFIAGHVPGVDTPAGSATTANGGRYFFGSLPPGEYFVHIPSAEFLEGGDLFSMASVPGYGLNLMADDNADDNGSDLMVPTSQGVSSAVFNFQPYLAPVDSLTETGFDRTSDNAEDNSIYLTIDFGFRVACPQITVTPATLSSGTQGVAYTPASFSASGGVAPYSYTISGGALPAGMVLSSAGVLSGTPTVEGSFGFGVRATDSNGCTGTVVVSLTIHPAGTTVGVGNLVFFDANGNGAFDTGEGVNGVTVLVYREGDTPGVSSPAATVTTSGGGLFFANELNAGNYFLHIPASMFASGAPLAGRLSLPGVGSTIDDTDENGQDAVNPAATGVSTAVFNLENDSEPTDASAETGFGADIDNANDDNADMTVDFGFTSALPLSFAAWQAMYNLGGQNGATQNPDGDLLPNMLEYAFGSAPDDAVTGTSAPGFTISRNLPVNQLDARIVRRAGGLADLDYRLEAYVSGAWTLMSVAPSVTANGDGYETARYINIEADPLLSGLTSGMIRLTVWLDVDQNDVPEAEATTAVWAWTRRAIEAAKPQTFSMPAARKEIFSGTVDAVSGDVLTLSVGAGNLVSALESGAQYYAEITDGEHEGHRYEVDEAATTAGTITLLPAHARSTQATVPSTLAGAPVILRPHWTLKTLFPTESFMSTNNQATADRALVYDRAQAKFTTYYLYTNSGNPKWVRQADGLLTDQGGLVVDACEGSFIHPRTTATVITESGILRVNDVICPLAAGTNFIGGFSIATQTLTDRKMLLADGFHGGVNAPSSDRVRIWRADTTATQSYQGYFLMNNTSTHHWVREQDATLASQETFPLFEPFRAAFIINISAKPLWKVPATPIP